MPRREPPAVHHGRRRPAGPAPAIFRIAGDGMAERSEVDADLVGAPGVQVTAHECMRAPSLDHLVAGARKTPARDDGHALPLARMAADGTLELSGDTLHRAANDCLVGAAPGADTELRRQRPV